MTYESEHFIFSERNTYVTVFCARDEAAYEKMKAEIDKVCVEGVGYLQVHEDNTAEWRFEPYTARAIAEWDSGEGSRAMPIEAFVTTFLVGVVRALEKR